MQYLDAYKSYRILNNNIYPVQSHSLTIRLAERKLENLACTRTGLSTSSFLSTSAGKAVGWNGTSMALSQAIQHRKC